MATIAPSAWTPSTPDSDRISSPIGPLQLSNARKPWSFSSPDDNTLRFEVRSGDVFKSSAWTDPVTSERNQVQEVETFYDVLHPVSTEPEAKVNFDFMIEPGAANTARWVQLAGFKGISGSNGNSFGGEPVELAMRGEKLAIVSNYESSPGHLVYRDIWVSPTPIERGKWYDIKINFDWGPSGDGKLDVFLDDKQIVDHDGQVGYYNQTAYLLKYGVYRAASPETMSAQIKNISMETGADLPDYQIGTPTPEPAPPPVPAPGPSATVVGTIGNDTLTGNWSSPKQDVIDGLAGDDTINGYHESDTLTGGPGRDIFGFNTPLGPSNIDTITDFNAADDTIHLNDIVFTDLGWGPLPSRYFLAGEAARNRNDHIIYDRSTGALSYDRDGTGSAAAAQFATLANKPVVAAADFSVI